MSSTCDEFEIELVEESEEEKCVREVMEEPKDTVCYSIRLKHPTQYLDLYLNRKV